MLSPIGDLDPSRPRPTPRTSTGRPGVSAVGNQRGSATNSSTKELDDLRAKLRIMEKKRQEDRDKLREVSRIQEERNRFEGVIQKLQQKYQPQQQEIGELRKQLKEAQARAEELERDDAEHSTAVELATLDREMAEETAEALRVELDTLQAKTEELELEVDILRAENQELAQDMTPEERAGQGWLSLEKSNDRLKEALLLLRDAKDEQEAELKGHVKELETDLQDFSTIKQQYEQTKEKLLISEANYEDIKQQLDTALGAEEMIEELTEKNMQCQEEIENLKASIEDLESLKELNDELEIHHIEVERQLQDEIDFQYALNGEQERRALQQRADIEELEYTISRFRELVSNLTSDLEDMRAAKQLTETEANDLTQRSRAMMDLNTKLQASASKTQVKTIDLELRRLEAQESMDHLAIVQEFLPESYAEEREAVLSHLRFKRVGFKANLLYNIVRERLNDHANVEEPYATYEVMEKLTWIYQVAQRFTKCMQSCSVETFARFQGALYELDPVERALNGYIEGLKKNDLNEQRCSTELGRSIALLTHLAETNIPVALDAQADEVQMKAVLVQNYLESVAGALSHFKDVVKKESPPKEKDAEAGDDEEEVERMQFDKSLDNFISQSRSAKVITSKIIRSVNELMARSLSFGEDASKHFALAEDMAKDLATCARSIGSSITTLVQNESRPEKFRVEDFTAAMTSALSGSNALPTLQNKLQALFTTLEDLTALTSDLSQTVEFERGPLPWSMRAKEIKSSKTISPDAEAEIYRLQTEVNERSTALSLRDKAFEEQNIRIELLEARSKDAKKNASLINELEQKITTFQERERDLGEAISAQIKEIQALEEDREKWKKLAEQHSTLTTQRDAANGNETRISLAADIAERDRLHEEIKDLQAAVRYLREDNRRARLTEPATQHSWLHQPLIPKETRDQQRKAVVEAECSDVLGQFIQLVKTQKMVDLTQTPEDKLKWRPAKETPRYQVARQREEYEAWAEWAGDVVEREREVTKMKERRKALTSTYQLPGIVAPKVDTDRVRFKDVEILEV